MLDKFKNIFEEDGGANHSHSLSYDADLQRRDLQKEIKVINNFSVV